MQGTRLGPYEILERLGAGGMGEVWAAQDTRLGRRVAIKVLPPELAADPERLARLQREARLLASLEHPNIAAIHGLEEVDGQRFLVMQLVAGKTLADRVQAGPLPVREAIAIATQVAEGLEAAHERGIVHRDLKSANIMVAEEHGEPAVKILDFGLAKSTGEHAAGAVQLTASPTVMAATGMGVLLGTAPYMSPEQARGREVDRRADIWAFGCVLYEMLVGRYPFEGDTVTDVLAAVVRAEPDWSRLPADTPAVVRDLVQRCLRKDLRRRLQHVGDARVQLQEASDGAADPAAARSDVVDAGRLASPAWLAWGGWAAAAALAVLAIRPLIGPAPAPGAAVRMVVDLTGGEAVGTVAGPAPVAISPDGRRLAWLTEGEGTTRLWARELADADARLLVEGPILYSPFFSPDGESIAYFSSDELQRLPFAGGLPMTLAPAVINPRGGSWSDAGFIVYAPGPTTGIWRVAETGGETSLLVAPDGDPEADSYRWPQIIDGGRRIVFTAGQSGDFSTARIVSHDLESGATETLFAGGFYGRVTSTGHLLFVREGSLYAAPLSSGRRALDRPPVPVIGEIAHNVGNGAGQFAVSDSGTLWFGQGGEVFSNAAVERWSDRGASRQVLDGVNIFSLQLSPDGSRLVEQRGVGASADLWVRDLTRDVATRLTFDGANTQPIWTRDGKYVTYFNWRGDSSAIYRLAADGGGAPQSLWPATFATPFDWTPDGTTLLLGLLDADGGLRLHTLRVTAEGGHDGTGPEPLDLGPGWHFGARLSPDGRWLAYLSAASPRPPSMMFVTAFPSLRGRWQVASDDSAYPMWSSDSRELTFVNRSPTGVVRVVEVDLAPRGDVIDPGAPQVLFQADNMSRLGAIVTSSGVLNNFDGAPDRDEYYVVGSVGDGGTFNSIVVLGWLDELNRQLASGR